MNRLSALALGIAVTLAPAPGLAAQEYETFEVVLNAHGNPIPDSTGTLLLEATSLALGRNGHGPIQIRRNDEIVGLFQSNYVVFVASRATEGRRTFLIRTQNADFEIRADELRVPQHGPAVFYTGGRITGVANPSYATTIADRSAILRGGAPDGE